MLAFPVAIAQANKQEFPVYSHWCSIGPMSASRCLPLLVLLCVGRLAGATPFWVRVVDADTGRGVPLVQLTTAESANYWTDSGGIAVIEDPALQAQDVRFNIQSDGYLFEQTVQGKPGAVLHVQAGTHDELKIKRLNIAERLYRVTGADIYRDTLLAGLKAPIAHPLLDSGVVGQDTNIATLYGDKIVWCWGDTDGLARFNGNTTCATSELPNKGGLNPSVGVNLNYFTREDGFVRPMVPIEARGLVWIEGLFTAKDEQGRERLLATYTRQEPGNPHQVAECGIVEFDDAAGVFRVIAHLPLPPHHTSSHPFHVDLNGKDYLYLYPVQRVPNDWKSVLDPGSYESYTCLKPGMKLDMADPQLERDDSGQLVCGWKHNTEWIDSDRERELVNRGLIDKAHANFPLVDVDTGKPTGARPDDVSWNAYRNKWVLLSKTGGMVYYSEADQPTGPWVKAKAVLTQGPYRLYNVVEHPFLESGGGRIIYFEGTFTAKLSAAKVEVPDYNYNNLMYRLDLSDPRLEAVRVK